LSGFESSRIEILRENRSPVKPWLRAARLAV